MNTISDKTALYLQRFICRQVFNRYEPSSPDAVATEDPVNKMVAPNTGSPVSLSNTLPEIVCATDAVEENRKKTITKKKVVSM